MKYLLILLLLEVQLSRTAQSLPSATSSPPEHDITADDIIKWHDKVQDAPIRNHNNLNIFAFVTPWNSKGESVSLAESERGRLDMASPVTYQVTPSGIQGGHDYTSEYYARLRQLGTRVIPRLLFEHGAWSLLDFQQLGKSTQPLIQQIVSLCRDNEFEGVVIEIWQTLLSTNAFSPPTVKSSLQLVRSIGTSLRDADILTVLVLPPYNQDFAHHGVEKDRIQQLSIAYSYFVVMTYDFSTLGGEPGPMAPSSWVRSVAEYLSQKCRLGDKVLLGLNFYGMDFVTQQGGNGQDEQQSRHVLGHDIIQLLQDHKPKLVWIPSVEEHAFQYSIGKVHRAVFYPTRTSISKRLAIANDVGCGGVAIWDLGQGLPHFFEEF